MIIWILIFLLKHYINIIIIIYIILIMLLQAINLFDIILSIFKYI